MQTMRVWHHNFRSSPMETVIEKGLDKVLLGAIPLEEHGPTSAHNVRPGAAVLADLAILEEGITNVIREYGIVNFLPLSDADPIVFMQQAEDSESRKALGYQQTYVRYLQEYARRLNLATPGTEMSTAISAWFEERLNILGTKSPRLLLLIIERILQSSQTRFRVLGLS